MVRAPPGSGGDTDRGRGQRQLPAVAPRAGYFTTVSGPIIVVRQPGREDRHIGDQDQEQEQHAEERQRRAHHPHHRHAGDAGGDEQVQPHRRGDHADLHVHHHDDAQMDRVDPQLDGDREHQRRDDDDQARGLHELAADQQDQVDHDQERHRAEAPAQHRLGDMLRHLLVGQHMLQDQRVGDDEHQHHRQPPGLDQRLAGVGVEEGGHQHPGAAPQRQRRAVGRHSGPMSR